MDKPGASVQRQMLRLSSEVKKAQPESVKAAALAAKNTHLARLQAVAPSGRLRGVGLNGAKVGVRFDTRAETAVVRATGPWQFIENKSEPHDIVPRARRGKRALATANGPFASVKHPGVRNPHRPWAKAKPAAAVVVKKKIEGAFTAAFRRGLH